jgi:hypothetical protein
MKDGKRWFILQQNQVQGPFIEEEIEGLVTKMDSPLIWGRGLQEWLPPIKWREALKTISLVPQSEVEPRWKYRADNQEFGPMSYNQMIGALREMPDHNAVKVWNDSQQEWQDVYSNQKVTDELGLTRRNHPRVPIMGNLQIESAEGTKTIKVISISEGGCGVSGANDIIIGQKFKGVLTSPNLFVKINCNCEVVYVGSEGFAGIRFVNLPIEGKGAIIEYINKFKDLRPERS